MHFGNNLVRRVIRLKLDGARARFELALVIPHTFRWIEFIPCTGEMQHIDFGVVIGRARLPISGNASTDAYNSTQTMRMCESEAIVERTRL